MQTLLPVSEVGPSERRVMVIASSGARVDARGLIRSLALHLQHDVDLDPIVVSSSAEATAAARRAARRADAVIAVGGDGTVADVATGIFGTRARLGIVPAGSTNITARSLGIPADPRRAIAALRGSWRLRTIDVGRSGDRSFLHMAGAGFDAELFKLTNPAWKRRVGWPAYLPAAAAALRLPPSLVTVSIDGTILEERSPLVLVANGGAAIAPSFVLHPEIAVDDGWLDVMIFTATTAAQIASTLGHLGSQRLDQSPHVLWRRGRSVRIDADPPIAVELDGDIRGWTPRQFTVEPASLRVIVPHP